MFASLLEGVSRHGVDIFEAHLHAMLNMTESVNLNTARGGRPWPWLPGSHVAHIDISGAIVRVHTKLPEGACRHGEDSLEVHLHAMPNMIESENLSGSQSMATRWVRGDPYGDP